MKQILLRVPDELHHKLATRAAGLGRSVNALATEILDSAVEAADGDRQSRLRARAAALGVLSEIPEGARNTADRDRSIAAARGLGPVLNRLLEEERERG